MQSLPSHLLLTPDDMNAADEQAAASGLDSFGLMIRAGLAVSAAALRLYPGAGRFVVLCGPGNNGGDGYIAASHLAEAGADVAVYHLGDPGALKGDAARARSACCLTSRNMADWQPEAGDTVIDAIFGAGLARAVPPLLERVIETVTAMGLEVVAVDLPSGIHGATGQPLGAAFRARRTVTFMARKPGHLLMPGREHCGEVEVFDIGIPARIVARCAGSVFENAPAVWSAHLPRMTAAAHKFSRGHLGVFSGNATATGAARLSALSGLTSGAGLVTVASPADALTVNASTLTAVMVRRIDDAAELSDWVADPRLSAFVLGPGFGAGEKLRTFVRIIASRKVVLDADGISSFRDAPQTLFSLFESGEIRLVLTPHAGEFARLFPDLAADDTLGKVEKARAAAKRAHAAVVMKGADTVIASPDGRAVINTNAPPWLATAGSGDVLAGIIGSLLAQGMPAFEAAAAGVYMHGAAADRAGPGLTAEDLVAAIPIL